MNMIRLGHARALLTGGAESLITPLSLASMGRLGALSQNNGAPEHASRPFDAARDGFVLGEGAGVVHVREAIERKEHGVEARAEVEGGGVAEHRAHVAAGVLAQALVEAREHRGARVHGGDGVAGAGQRERDAPGAAARGAGTHVPPACRASPRARASSPLAASAGQMKSSPS